SHCGRRTVVVSGGGSACADRGDKSRPATPAAERPAKKRRRFSAIFMGPLLPSKAAQGLQAASLRSHETIPAGNHSTPAGDAIAPQSRFSRLHDEGAAARDRHLINTIGCEILCACCAVPAA